METYQAGQTPAMILKRRQRKMKRPHHHLGSASAAPSHQVRETIGPLEYKTGIDLELVYKLLSPKIQPDCRATHLRIMRKMYVLAES
jgi:hypothetical protein